MDCFDLELQKDLTEGEAGERRGEEAGGAAARHPGAGRLAQKPQAGARPAGQLVRAASEKGRLQIV